MAATINEGKSRKVTSRRSLRGNLRVSVKVPKKIRNCVAPDGRPYVQFGIPVKGGFINFHIFDEIEMRGQRVRAEATIMVKALDDGTEYLYVDLTRPSDGPLTHELKIVQDRENVPAELTARSPQQFNCRGGIQGSILVCKL